jgi:general stress protein YciG
MASNQGGDSKQPGGSERGGSGNFANDPQRASEAGKKGGQHSQGGSAEDSTEKSGGSQRGGSGNFANDPERASEAGRKGGESSHRGSSK